jgi:tRNA A-37 threonylcarbamoyl transferase component Bud32
MGITVRDKISESSTTSVYRAVDETLGREVLLKVLHRHLAHDEQVRQRFVREARACATLHSEHIVQVFDLRDYEGSPAIVMEYVSGRPLKEIIEAGHQRTFAFAKKVALGVLSGLSVAHSHGIIHRDIKPGNILVSTAGTVKITDFGLAQVPVSPSLTSEGMVVGTPAYFAPELIQGQPAGARSDLFSLGATLVETLTGERLFEGATYAECLNRISRFTIGSLDAFTSATSPEFVAFLKKLMDPDPGRRFATPGEALLTLDPKASSQVGLPLPSQPTRRTMMRVGVPLLALVIVAGALFLVRMSTHDRPQNNSPVAADSASAHNTAAATTMKTDPARAGGESHDARRSISDLGTAVPGAERQIPPAPESPTDIALGSLTFSGNHGAKVRIDDQPVGELPIREQHPVQAGMHTVVFTLPPFDPIVRIVRVGSGERLDVAVDFLQTAAYLRCLAKPWAEIYVDDQYRDTTPMNRPIPVSAGQHRIRFHHPSFRDTVWEVSLAPLDTMSLSMTFK